MKIFALIPLRGGSKGVPRKNIKNLNGKPLCQYVIDACINSQIFNEIWVSTDDYEIEKICLDLGVKVYIRPPELGSDTATTNSVIYDFLVNCEKFDLLYLIQATNPFLVEEDFITSYKKYKIYKPDLILSACPSHSFIWDRKEKYVSLMNNSVRRRQDCNRFYEENGGFYIFTPDTFIVNNGIPFTSNKVMLYETQFKKHIEIDDEIDFKICEVLMSSH